MMKDTLLKALIGAALVLGVAGANAQTKPTKKPAPAKTASAVKKSGEVCAVPAKGAKTVACAVMPEDKVDIAAAVKAGNFADYKGKRYVFCCPHCISSFKANPAKYAAKATPAGPTPKSTSKKA